MKRACVFLAAVWAALAGGSGAPGPSGAVRGAGAPARKQGLTLGVKADKTTFTMQQLGKVRFTVVLRNEGKVAVTLVQPGDGSDCGWRTPRIWWSVLRADDRTARHAQRQSPNRGRRCGNVNALKSNEVFTLKPGQGRELTWVGVPHLPGPGTYRMVFCYENVPGLKWRGVPLGKHDPATLKRAQGSHPCLLRSNELKLTVTRAK
jgi:hypothetical protein